jgi:protein TonB
MRNALISMLFPWWLTLSAAVHLGMAYWWVPEAPERVVKISLDQGRTSVNMRRSIAQPKPVPKPIEKELPVEKETPVVTPIVFEPPPPPPAPLPLEVPRPERLEEEKPPEPVKIERARMVDPVVLTKVQAVETPDSVAATGAVDVEPSLLVNPTPHYPRDALLARQTGEVILKVRVSIDGRAISAAVHRSSGVRSLDEAALSTVKERWKFSPAKKKNLAVEHEVFVPVLFRIAN